MGMKVPAGLCHKCLGKATKGRYCETCKPPSKYRSRKVSVHDRQFDSQKEADRYRFLLICQTAGIISGLECQVRFPLVVGGVKICTYVADFVYHEGPNLTGEKVVEDVKGYRTRVYNLKKKLLLAIHGIRIREF